MSSQTTFTETICRRFKWIPISEEQVLTGDFDVITRVAVLSSTPSREYLPLNVRRTEKGITPMQQIDALYQEIADLEEANETGSPTLEIQAKIDDLRRLQQQEAQRIGARLVTKTRLDDQAAEEAERRARELLGLDE